MITTKQYHRITRGGKLLRVREQQYLRDDIPCGLEDCNLCSGDATEHAADGATLTQSISQDARDKRILVIDTNVCLHQMDLLEASGSALTDVIVLQTVMKETKHRSLSVYTRLLELIKSVSRRFVPFANENHRDTFVERNNGESANDHKDRLIRTAAAWLGQHYASSGLNVIFVTNDKASAAAAAAAGLVAHTLRQLGPVLFPLSTAGSGAGTGAAGVGGAGGPAGARTALSEAAAKQLRAMLEAGPEEEASSAVVGDGMQEEDGGVAMQVVQGGGGSAGVEAHSAASSTGMQVSKAGRKNIYPEHLPEHVARDKVRAREAFQGTLRVSKDCWFEGRVTIYGVQGAGAAAKSASTSDSSKGKRGATADSLIVLLLGRQNLNRALEGDSVVIELLPPSQWRVPGAGGSSRLVLPTAQPEEQDRLEEEALASGAVGNGAGARSAASEASSQQALARAAALAGTSGATPTGRVVSILRRAFRPLCGSLEPSAGGSAEGGSSSSGAVVSQTDGSAASSTVLFVPVDARYPWVRLDTRQKEALLDKRFIVSVDGWDAYSRYPRGHYVRTIGAIGDKGAENDVILLEHDIIARPFSADVIACLPPADWRITPVNSVGRTDLRHLDICSIDPPGCKDIDDALHARVIQGSMSGQEGAGPQPLPTYATDECEADAAAALPCTVEVGVHIADVTYFVKQGTAIDVEAAQRGNTTYLVEKRLDMLPGLLTETLCSLRGGVDRFAFSVTWRYERFPADASKEELGILVKLPPADRWRLVPGSQQYFKSIIHSRAAMTYAQAQALLDAPLPEGSPLCSDQFNAGIEAARLNMPYVEPHPTGKAKPTPSVASSVRLLASIARSLRARRVEAGALSLASSEVRFMLDSETADPVDVYAYESRETNSTVEEFMLLGNVAVAEKVTATYPLHSLLRRHPSPPASQFASLAQAAAAVEVTLDTSSSRALADSLDRAAADEKSTPARNKLLRILTTRCMMQAQYFPSGLFTEGEHLHYGLAAKVYTHFTSPIRRYADVVVHRLLAAAIGVDPLPAAYTDSSLMKALADNMNKRHLMSALAGRASASLHTNLFFKGRVVVESGVVMRIRANGVVVLIPRFGLESVIIVGRPADTSGPGQHTSSSGPPQRILHFKPETQELTGSAIPPETAEPNVSIFQEVKVCLYVVTTSRGRKELRVHLVQPAFQSLPDLTTMPQGTLVEDRTGTYDAAGQLIRSESIQLHAGVKRVADAMSTSEAADGPAQATTTGTEAGVTTKKGKTS